MKKEKSPPPSKRTASEIAARAGCSRQLVSRLLSRGFSEQQIVERVEERKRREAARAPASNSGGPVNGFPTLPGSIPPFRESEAKKEAHLAELRGLEVARAKGEVVPLQPFRAITEQVLRFQRDCLWLWPEDLASDLTMRTQAEVSELLRRRIEHLFRCTDSFLEAECRKYGIRLPPPSPERPRLRLAYYERYCADSRAGRIETIPPEERFESAEWHRQHPSIGAQQWFEILRKKRAWDKAMGELLAKRSEWDLPPEVPEPPPVPLPEDNTA